MSKFSQNITLFGIVVWSLLIVLSLIDAIIEESKTNHVQYLSKTFNGNK